MIKRRRNYTERSIIISVIFIIMALILLVKIFIIQIIDNSGKHSSDNISTRHLVQHSGRGNIYDREGRLLVFNEISYDLMVVPRETKGIDTLAFCKLLGIDKNDYERRFNKAKNYSPFLPSVFFGQVTKEEYGVLSNIIYHYPGFYFERHMVRGYSLPIAAHILGYIGEVNNNDLERDSHYHRGDYIGKSGLEYSYENVLRGKNGLRVVTVDVHGNVQGSYCDGIYDTLPVAGTDLILGLDAELQLYGEQLMANKMGSIVAIDPKSGDVLAMVSAPSYDPNKLVGRERNRSYPILNADEKKPLLNRAASGLYPPGSTFKIVNGLIGLQSGVINEHTRYVCNGPKSAPIKCTHNHISPTTLPQAVENSCNPYFWNVFRDVLTSKQFNGVKNGFDYWHDLVVSFGFGSKFDSDLSFVAKGNIPTREYYDKCYRGSWNAMTVRSLSIGQGEILISPVQLANYAAALGNEGFYYVPHLVKAFGDGRPLDSTLTTKKVINIDKKHFQTMKKSMRRVFEEGHGTARSSAIEGISVAGKTGTAQNPHGKDHSIFIAFAPVENPQIAIAVIVENAGFGSTYAAPIATLMIEKYIRREVRRQNLEKFILEAQLQ